MWLLRRFYRVSVRVSGVSVRVSVSVRVRVGVSVRVRVKGPVVGTR